MIKLIKSNFYNKLEIRKKLANFILELDRLGMRPHCQIFDFVFIDGDRFGEAVKIDLL